MTKITYNGSTYFIPATGDQSWGDSLSSYLVALATGSLNRSGGIFQITADVNFGSTNGLIAQYFTARNGLSSSNAASAGSDLTTPNRLRLGVIPNASPSSAIYDAVAWRNNANNADLRLLPHAGSETILSYNGIDLVDVSSAQTLTNKTIDSPSFTGQILAAPGSAAIPSYSFTGNGNVGAFESSGTFGLATNGVVALLIDPSQVVTITGSTTAKLLLAPIANQDAVVYASLNASSTSGNSYFVAQQSAGTKWSMGMGLTDTSSNWVLAQSDGFGTSSKFFFEVTTSGAVTIGASGGTQSHSVNGNLSVTGNNAANSFLAGYASTATAAGTTTLTVSSAQQQYFTGSTTQTVKLPVVSTLVLGQSFNIVNNSSGVVTVQSSGGNTIQAMAGSTELAVTVISTSGTTASSWNAQYTLEAPVNAITALTGDITATGPGSVASTLASVNSNIGTFASATVNAKGLVTAAAALSGDATTSSSVLTLATVNSNTGSFGSSTAIPVFTVNGKGLITAASTAAVVAPASTLTGTTLASNVITSSLTTVGTLASPTLTTPTINGGTHTAITSLGIRDTSAAFDVTLAATSSTALTAGRTLTIDTVNASSTFKLGANLTVTGATTVNGTFSGTSSGTNTGDQTTVSGNAGTATALQTARAINGVNFDGTAAITVTAAAGTLTGTTLNSTVVTSSLTSVGTLANLTVTNPISGSVTGNAATVTTNANLTGPVTSVGNATTIGSGQVSDANLAVSYLKADGSRALTGNWGAGAFSGTFNGVAVGSAANTISGLVAVTCNADRVTFTGNSGNDTTIHALSLTNHTSTFYSRMASASTTGSAYFITQQDAGVKWSMGMDLVNTSSAWALANSDGFGTASLIYMRMSTSGSITIGAASATQQHALNTATGTTGVGAGTLANLPTGKSGNPTGYVQITINGSTAYIPYW